MDDAVAAGGELAAELDLERVARVVVDQQFHCCTPRIFYDGKYFDYPLTAKDVVGRFGIWESTRCALSYLAAQTTRSGEAETFEEWVTQRFGKRLYDAFFRTSLDDVLASMGHDPTETYALLVGGATHLCVYHAVMGYYLRNYWTVVVTDGQSPLTNDARVEVRGGPASEADPQPAPAKKKP